MRWNHMRTPTYLYQLILVTFFLVLVNINQLLYLLNRYCCWFLVCPNPSNDLRQPSLKPRWQNTGPKARLLGSPCEIWESDDLNYHLPSWWGYPFNKHSLLLKAGSYHYKMYIQCQWCASGMICPHVYVCIVYLLGEHGCHSCQVHLLKGREVCSYSQIKWQIKWQIEVNICIHLHAHMHAHMGYVCLEALLCVCMWGVVVLCVHICTWTWTRMYIMFVYIFTSCVCAYVRILSLAATPSLFFSRSLSLSLLLFLPLSCSLSCALSRACALFLSLSLHLSFSLTCSCSVLRARARSLSRTRVRPLSHFDCHEYAASCMLACLFFHSLSPALTFLPCSHSPRSCAITETRTLAVPHFRCRWVLTYIQALSGSVDEQARARGK